MSGKHSGREPPWVTSILSSQDLPVHEKTLDRLYDEAVALSGAGETTTQNILTIAMFHLLQQPATLKELKDEILTVFPDVTKPPSLAQLETLPLLASTITEGISSFQVLERFKWWLTANYQSSTSTRLRNSKPHCSCLPRPSPLRHLHNPGSHPDVNIPIQRPPQRNTLSLLPHLHSHSLPQRRQSPSSPASRRHRVLWHKETVSLCCFVHEGA